MPWGLFTLYIFVALLVFLSLFVVREIVKGTLVLFSDLGTLPLPHLLFRYRPQA